MRAVGLRGRFWLLERENRSFPSHAKRDAPPSDLPGTPGAGSLRQRRIPVDTTTSGTRRALHQTSCGTGEQTLIFLHFLGGSGREWTGVTDRLQDQFRCVALDLPGFGESADLPGYSVAEMADAVERALGSLAPERWLLVGHSMGAKVATVLARRLANAAATDGPVWRRGLEGMVTVAGSPPSPEPMGEGQRAKMLRSLGERQADAAKDHQAANQFIRDNLAGELPTAEFGLLTTDVHRMSRAAWNAWLESGSKEDWSDRVGVLDLPALVIAGAEDGPLGPEGQRRLMLPHLGGADTVKVIAGASHLMPVEAPGELAGLIREFVAGLNPGGRRDQAARAVVPDSYMELLESDRVSTITRAALLDRAQPVSAYEPKALDRSELELLRAVLARVIPQPGGSEIDLAARMDKDLAEGRGDGWRFADLPPDAEGCRAGLQTLDRAARSGHGSDFATLDPEQKDALLECCAAGELGVGPLDAGQMKLWFEDLRGAATGAYVAHPATLARMGYSGIADGANSERLSGFVKLGIGAVEPWEPATAADSSFGKGDRA